MSDNAAPPASLLYWGGRLAWPGGDAPAACGRAGVRSAKREGDGASPAGTFPLLSALYRPDRMAPPRTGLPLSPLQPDDWWVDDPADANYNRLVSLPYPAHGEAMWRDDGLYDIVVEVGYNVSPIVLGAGSAIFLHVAHADLSPTAGCIAVARNILIALMPLLAIGSTITIRD